MSEVAFTGERLHAGDELFAVDVARHRAAYELAHGFGAARVLDLGCGAGYGAASLANGRAAVVGIDLVSPDPASRVPGAHFVRARMEGIPVAPASFDLVVSFQVIEHLEDPTPYVDALADLLRPEGTALVTTPNLLMSDGVNPYHVHEYEAAELARCLSRRFAEVEMRGVGASEPVRRYMEARSRRIRRIMRIDPLRLRERIPRAFTLRLFALFAVLVRRRTTGSEAVPDVSASDFPIGPAAEDCFDLLAVCRRPRP